MENKENKREKFQSADIVIISWFDSGKFSAQVKCPQPDCSAVFKSRNERTRSKAQISVRANLLKHWIKQHKDKVL